MMIAMRNVARISRWSNERCSRPAVFLIAKEVLLSSGLRFEVTRNHFWAVLTFVLKNGLRCVAARLSMLNCYVA